MAASSQARTGGKARLRPLTLLFSAWLAAAEAPPPPDPEGLGERSALYEALRGLGQRPEAGLPDAELRRLYQEAWQAAQTEPEAAEERDRRARLARQLRERHGVEVDAGLGLADLVALRDRLLEAKAVRDTEAIQRLLDEDPGRDPAAEVPDPPPAVSTPDRPATGPTGAGAGPLRPQAIPFPSPGVSACWLLPGAKPALCVLFGHERAGEFRGVFGGLHRLLQASPAIPDAVFLLGHGGGSTINGVPIAAHLRQHREFYESLGGTRPARPVACLVLATCAKGNPGQMEAMRDGLGYYPVWRVATWDDSTANRLTVMLAFQGLAERTDASPLRRLYRTGRGAYDPASLAEVGADGVRGELEKVQIIVPEQEPRR